MGLAGPCLTPRDLFVYRKTQAFSGTQHGILCKSQVGKAYLSLRGIHGPAVSCQNAKGLIDSFVLNYMFDLISTLRLLYMEHPQSLCIDAVLFILYLFSTAPV